jgi:hypothetical protein
LIPSEQIFVDIAPHELAEQRSFTDAAIRQYFTAADDAADATRSQSIVYLKLPPTLSGPNALTLATLVNNAARALRASANRSPLRATDLRLHTALR